MRWTSKDGSWKSATKILSIWEVFRLNSVATLTDFTKWMELVGISGLGGGVIRDANGHLS